MKTPKSLFGIIVLLLLIMNFVLLRKSNTQKGLLHSYKTSLNETIIEKNTQKKDFLTLETIRFNTENTLDYIYFENAQSISGDILNIKEAIGDNEKIVFFFSENSCHPCVEQELRNLKKISQHIGKDNIIIIASYSNKRYFSLFLTQHEIPYNAFMLNNSYLNMPEEINSNTFLCVMDTYFNTKLLFVPDKNYPEFSIQYYDVLKKRFQKQTTTKYLRLLDE